MRVGEGGHALLRPSGQAVRESIAHRCAERKAMSEQWRAVVGYEGLYEVSSTGRVRRLAGISEGKHKYPVKARELKQSRRNGYPFLALCKAGKPKREYVHRLVAEAFIPNPDNLPCVNHKDETRTNNNVENLEWCTKKYNVNYGTRAQRFSEIMRNKSCGVQMFSRDGELITVFRSVMDAHEATGISISNIAECASGTGRHKSAGGYIWKYMDRR